MLHSSACTLVPAQGMQPSTPLSLHPSRQWQTWLLGQQCLQHSRQHREQDHQQLHAPPPASAVLLASLILGCGALVLPGASCWRKNDLGVPHNLIVLAALRIKVHPAYRAGAPSKSSSTQSLPTDHTHVVCAAVNPGSLISHRKCTPSGVAHHMCHPIT